MDILDSWYVEFRETVAEITEKLRDPKNGGIVYYTKRDVEEDWADGIAATVAAELKRENPRKHICMCGHHRASHKMVPTSGGFQRYHCTQQCYCESFAHKYNAYLKENYKDLKPSVMAIHTDLPGVHMFFIEDYSEGLIDE